MSRNNLTISYAFPSIAQVVEEYGGGKPYNYSFDTSAYLAFGLSFAHSRRLSHYFELRTKNGFFSLFDFQYVSETVFLRPVR